MKPTFALFIITVFGIMGTASRTRADVTMEALDRQRSGASSDLSIGNENESLHNFTGSGKISIEKGSVDLTLLSSGQTDKDKRAFVNPTYLFLSRPFGQFLTAGGVGYDFDETKQQSSSSSLAFIGPGVSPVGYFGEANKRTLDFEWSSRRSLIINMNSLFLFQPHQAFFAGIEASYIFRRGLRYSEEFQNPPNVALARYFDYNHGAYGASLSAVAGYWREAHWANKAWSLIGKAWWDLLYERSTPNYLANVGSSAFTSMPLLDQTIQYGGQRNNRNNFGIEFSVGDANPDRLLLAWIKRSPWWASFFPADSISIMASYLKQSDFFTYVNNWRSYHGDEWATTYHQYDADEIQATVSPHLRLYFFRYLFLDADGNVSASWSRGEVSVYWSRYATITSSALFNAGIRVPFGNNCLAGFQMNFAEFNSLFREGTTAQWGRPNFRLSLIILDTGKR